MCRFSDAGMTRLATSSEAGVGKAPRHEIAWGVGTVGAAGSMGIQPRRRAGRGWVESSAPIALRGRMGVGDGRNERSGGWRTGLAVRLRPDLSTGGKQGLCWPRASRNGERHWVGGLLVTAS